MPQTARPTSDVTLNGWTTQDGGVVDVFATLDEVTASDADRAQIQILSGTDETLKIGLGSTTDPAASTGHVLTYRIGKLGPNQVTMELSLRQGATEITTWEHSRVFGAGTYARALSPAETDAITNYAALQLWARATEGGDEVLVGAGNRLSAIGASNVNAIGAPPNIESDGFMYWVWFGANNLGRYVYHPQVALGAEPLADTLTRVTSAVDGFDSHAVTYGRMPSHAIMQCGRNDMIFTTASDVAGKLALYEAIADAALDRGILPIFTAVFPSDSATSAALHQRNLQLFNMGIALMAAKKGLPYIDVNNTIIDTTTGGIQTAYALDALHPNDIGAKIIGDAMVAKLIASDGIAPYWDVPLANSNDANSDDAYKLTNMLMLADTGGQPTNWTEGGADVANLVTSTVSGASDGILGDWMKMVKTTTAGDAQNASSSFSLTAGRWIAVGWAEKYVHTSGTPIITTRLRTSPSNTDVVYKKIQSDSAQSAGVTKHFQIFKVPVGDTSGVISVIMNAVGEYYFGQVTVMDLTAYGLDAWI